MTGETIFTVAAGLGAPTRGEKPAGPGFDLGPFACLRNARPELLADCIVGQSVGSRATESEARERLRWVKGIPAGSNAELGAVALDLLANSGLFKISVDGGARHWVRTALAARFARNVNLPPEPVGTEPIAVSDDATRKLRRAELRDLDARVRAIVADELRARGL